MPENVLYGDYFFTGNLRAGSMTAANNSVRDAQVAAGADVGADKLVHRHQCPFDQPNTAATSETRVIHRCYGATGTIRGFHAGSIVAATGNSTVTVDLRKNGTTVLSAVITLDNANTARVAEAGSVSVTTLVQGDVLEVVTVATVGTGTLPTGLFAFATVDNLPI